MRSEKRSAEDVRVSFISTVRNDEDGLRLLLGSLLAQTKLPDEVVLVDASLSPGPGRAVREFEESARMRGVKTLLLARAGCTISEGRNLATENARHEVIASSDTGCLLDERWLEALTAPFGRGQVDVVAGTYRPMADTPWERATAAFLMPDPDRIASRLPSARSLAYTKSAWRTAGGFPDWLSHGEDTRFALCLRETGAVLEFAPGALVYWRPRPGPLSFMKQVFFYSQGDGMAGSFGGYYAKKITVGCAGLLLALLLPLFPLLTLLLVLLIGATLFLLWRRVPGNLRGKDVLLLLLPVMSIHLFAQAAGYTMGLGRRALGKSRTSSGGRGDA